MTLYKINSYYVLFDNNDKICRVNSCMLFSNVLDIYNAYKNKRFTKFEPYSNWKFSKITEFADIDVFKDLFPEEFV